MFNKIIDKLKKAQTVASYRAINKATSKANTQFKRNLSKELGISNKELSKRFKTKKANSKSLRSEISVGTKFGFTLDYFKPKTKIVKTNKRKYKGVTIKVGKGSREAAPLSKYGTKPFLITIKTGKSLVVAKNLAGKMHQPRLNFVDKAEQAKQGLQSRIRQDFELLYKQELKHQLKKL